ncbi:hypothetical protein EJB05_14325, partial [Eragrostis curvula]
MSKRTLLTYFSTSSSANGGSTSTPNTDGSTNAQAVIGNTSENRVIEHEPKTKRAKVEFRFSDIVGHPGNRKPIDHYAVEIRDQVKRAYALAVPTQPINHTFLRRWQSGEYRSFQTTWYDKFDWLEYSVSKDAAFCLYCYLFFQPGKPSKFGSDVFAKSGYTNWKKALKNFQKHSDCKTHGNARLMCEDFMNQRSSVTTKWIDTSKQEEIRYKIRLTTSLEVARYLIEQGDAFRGHDESESSLNRGKFREMVEWYKKKKKSVKDAYENGCQRNTMLSHHIQKDLRINTVDASCMRKDVLLAKHHDVLLEKVENGVITTGKGLNQESSLARPGDTRWGSHLKTLLRIFQMWDAIMEVLEIVKQDSVKPTCNGGAFGLIGKMQSFDFVLIMFLMIDLLSITDDLSRALQRKDQDIVEATSLILDVKDRSQDMRENGWEPLFKRVTSFCDKYEIKVPKMDKEVKAKGTYTRKRQKVTNMHFYHVDIFIAAIDSILTEMNHRFNEVSSELLVCMAALNPRNNFSNFDVDKLVRLAEIYSEDFTVADCLILRNQLQSFILNIRRSEGFARCKDLPKVAEKMVQTGKNRSFPLVYRLIELILILPVATASVERAFSAFNIIKTDLRNKMGDEWLNDLMICYIEKEKFRSIGNERIIQEFEEMKKRQQLVPKNNLVAIVTHEN